MSTLHKQDTVSVSLAHVLGPSYERRDAVGALRFQSTGVEVELTGTRRRFTIGKSPECDVEIDDEYVSSLHSSLERRADGTMVLRDEGSKNGTYLNGVRVDHAEVRPGSLLTLGKTNLIAIAPGSRNRLTAMERLRGEDPAFREAIDVAIRTAASECNVFIIGETGTGKELVARAIHEASARASGPFVALNCGAIPAELIGSELFGHERGAFTGAVNDRDGVFVQAEGGTLFLDEVGELPPDQQPHLLRVLETRMVRPIGGKSEQPVDVRLIAATNRVKDLGKESSRLRLDLYHRLATVPVHLPPLRQRTADIPLLVQAFMDELTPYHGPRTISAATLRALANYAWPGNVRELRNSVERAMALCPRELVVGRLLPPSMLRYSADNAPTATARTLSGKSSRSALPLRISGRDLNQLDRVLRDLMLEALEQHGTIRGAARSLGMPKSTFADRAKKFGIRRSDRKQVTSES